MTEYIQVEGHQDLFRDKKSNGIVNRNRSAFENARARAADARKQRDEINTLKCEMHEIKDMLTILLDRK